RQIAALEADNFSALPGMAFVRGFLRNYARYLGLDPAPLLAGVERLAGQGDVDLSPIRNADGELPIGGSAPKLGAASVRWMVLLLVAALLAGWYFDWFRTEPVSVERMLETPAADTAVLDSQPMVVPSAPVEASSVTSMTPTDSPADVRPQTDSAAPTEEAAPAEPVAPVLPAVTGATAEAGDAPVQSGSGGRLAFRFAGESWVEVRDATGAIVYSGVNRAGTERNVQGTPPFALVIGNATNVVLEFDGKPVDLAPHTKVSVARLTVK
ncbi:helix-turn-helix domain-containing protein, partial [Thauera sp.]